MPSSNSARLSVWLMFWISSIAAIAFFFMPAFIIRPFTHQSARGLAWAMAMRQSAPLPTLIAALVCIVLAVLLWDSGNLRRKIVLSSVIVLVLFSAVMSRLNYFEWMFHPVDSPQFEAEAASKLAGKEMILAVQYGPDARAYPIREMAYHHILNDVVQGVPIAVTY
jgi:Protein of unknown function (DUF3179)